jgi:carboxypeptidase C (cathepsin A)
MFGLFLENGPLRVHRNGTGPDDYVLKAAEASWTDKYSVVFIDQPVGTGFSYGDSVLTSMLDGSKEFLHFLVEFLEKYPEFKMNG